MTTSDIFKNTVFDHISPFPMIVCSVAAGILLGMMFDVFSLTERFFGKNRIIIFFTDVISVILTYLFLFVCAYNFNGGIIRWYCVVLCLAFLRLQRKLISKPFLKLCNLVLGITEKTLKLASKILGFPTKKLFSFCVFVYRKTAKRTVVFLRNRAYIHERNRIVSRAGRGFGLAAQLREEKEWKKIKRTSRVKELVNLQQ